MKCLSLVLFLFFFNLYAEASPHYFFNQITVKEGLASNNVYAIWQDNKGYVWLGTDNGLQRFDGQYFLYFQVKKPVALPAKPVRQILEDKEGNMWLRYGDDYGIFNPADLSFHHIPFEKHEDRYRGEKLWMDSQGNIYLILRRNKLLYFDREKGFFSEKNPPIKVPDGYHPNAVFEDTKTGYFWISCEEGLAVFDSNSNKTYHRNNNPLQLPYLDDPNLVQVVDYFIDTSRNHWLVFWNPQQRFGSYDEKSGKYAQGAPTLTGTNLSYREMSGSFETKSGEIWYFGVNSLYVYQPQEKDFDPIDLPTLKYNQVFQLYEDREGSLWLGTDQGVFHYTGKSPDVAHYLFDEGDPKHEILGIKEISLKNQQHVFWLPSWGRGIVILDRNFKVLPSAKIYENAPKDIEIRQPWDLIQEKSTGLIWVGTQNGGLQIIDPNTLQANFYSFPVFRQSTIRSLVEDLNGNIWFTTQRGDLIRYEKGDSLVNDSFEFIQRFNGLALELLVDKQNRIWVCTSNSGVYSVDGASGEILLHLDNSVLSSNKQEKIAQLNDSIFFFGYDLLNAYNVQSGENRILSYADGLISNKILNMQVDADGFLWIFTPNGICRYHYFKNTFTQYGQKESFISLSSDGDGGTVTSDGRIIFTGYQSLAAFNPSLFNRSIKPDRPTLTNIKLFDHLLFVDSLNTQERRTFSHDKNAFTFYFSTLSFINHEKLKYFYRLSGIDSEWRASGPSNMAVYSLLPPGNYSLTYRSENDEGISSPIETFSFKIQPPFHGTWWFRLAIATLMLAIVIVMYKLHINRILAVMKVRNRVARDLHDDMGSTLSTINILSSMAKTKLHTEPVKASEFISKISDNSQRMMEAMDDIVWSIKPQNDNMEKVVARMREFSTNALEAKNIEFCFDLDAGVEKVRLNMEDRRDLFLIFKEAINNLVKYSRCNRAYIHLYVNKNHLYMRIKDYGGGFDPDDSDTGNGLSNMKSRALNMDANLQITSEIGNGTEVVLAVKL